jgi:Flp pilus assembly protein TadD
MKIPALMMSLFLCLQGTAWAVAGVEECKALIEAYPDSPMLYDRLGTALVNAGDLTNAEVAFQKAIKLDRTYGRSWYNLGVLKMSLGDQDSAIGYFILAATVDTNDSASLVNLGSLYSLRNDLPMATRYYQRARGLAPNDPELLNNLGLLALKERNYPGAVSLLEEAFRQKQDEDIRFNLAVALSYTDGKARIRELYPFVSPETRHYSDVLRLLRD